MRTTVLYNDYAVGVGKYRHCPAKLLDACRDLSDLRRLMRLKVGGVRGEQLKRVRFHFHHAIHLNITSFANRRNCRKVSYVMRH